MKRTASALVLLAAVGGCVTMDQGPSASSGCGSCGGWTSGPPRVPGVQGPWGQPVAMAAPYSASPPGAEAARAMLAQSVPLELVQAGAVGGPDSSSGVKWAGGMPGPHSAASITPPGLPGQPIVPAGFPPGAVAATGALTGPSSQQFPTKRTEVRFLGPDKMRVSWCGTTPEGMPAQGGIDVPGRFNFVQGALYRLKLSNIASLPGVDLYPTLEVVPANARTEAFLAHSAVPLAFTNEDFEQVQAGNYLIKVVYLPNPPFQELAAVGPDEIVSSRLEPGADPIAEAHRRGNILLVIRMGNIDLGLANSPPMGAPSPYGPTHHATAPGKPGSTSVPGTPMPPMTVSGRPLMATPGAQAVPSVLPTNPGTPMTGQTVPLSPLSDFSVPYRTQPKDTSAGAVMDSTPPPNQTTTVITSTPKRHWWWPAGGSDK